MDCILRNEIVDEVKFVIEKIGGNKFRGNCRLEIVIFLFLIK